MDERWTERRLLAIPPDLLAMTPNGPVPISISPDALHAAAFAALRPHGGPSVLVRDEPRGAPVQGRFSRPSWSADGRRFACLLHGEDGRVRAVVDEKPSPTFAEILSFVGFSPDGLSFSYTARERDRYFVLVDHSPVHEEAYVGGFDAMRGAPGPRWEVPQARADDARRTASEAILQRLNQGDVLETPAGAARLEFDNLAKPLSLRVGPRTLDLQRPAASELAAFAWDAAGHWGALLRRGGKPGVLVVDGNERESRVDNPVLFASPDGAALIYNYRGPTGLFVAAGARTAGPFSWLGDIECSPGGLVVAFPTLAGREVRWTVVPVEAR
jgi:hypothetical protein